jgi:hypothetical protein
MADEENIMMEQNFQFSNDPNVNDSNGNDPNANYSNANYSNTSYSNENDKEKEKKNQSTQDSQVIFLLNVGDWELRSPKWSKQWKKGKLKAMQMQ